MMMMMMMMINCFYGVVDRQKAFSIISSQGHCQWSSPSRISNTLRAGFEPTQNLSSGLVEWSCTVVITTAPRRHLRWLILIVQELTLTNLIGSVTWVLLLVKLAVFQKHLWKVRCIFLGCNQIPNQAHVKVA